MVDLVGNRQGMNDLARAPFPTRLEPFVVPLQRQAQRRELLAELVVQIARDAGALVLLRGDDAAAAAR